MQASLCSDMLNNAIMAYAELKCAIVHSDRGVHYILSFKHAPVGYVFTRTITDDT